MTDYSKLIAGAEAQGVLDDLEADLRIMEAAALDCMHQKT